MRHRFTVIEGGIGSPPAAVAQADADPAAWSIDVVRANAVTEERVAVWRDLLARLRIAEPVFVDPDYLLAAAQHQGRDMEPVFAFVFGSAAGRVRLDGVVGLVMPHPVWGRNRVRPWQPPGLTLAPTIHPSHADAIDRTLDEGLAGLGLHLDRTAAGIESASSLLGRTIAPLRLALSARRAIPAGNLLGIRAPGVVARDRPETERIVEPGRIRDAVEEFLGLDARVSARPIVDDPSEAAMVRVVTRRFGQRGQVGVDLVRRSGRLVTGRIHLGTGAGTVLWKQAEDRRAVIAAVPIDDRISG